MPDSLRDHLADVLLVENRSTNYTSPYLAMADALLADPTLRAIIDLAAWDDRSLKAAIARRPYLAPEVRALLADWREQT